MYYGKKIILRGMELSDVDSIMKKWNTLELRKTLANLLPNSKEEEVDWVKSTWKARNAGTAYQFIITDYDNNFIGTIGLFAISKINRYAELGIAIHDIDNRGKGYGTDAVITLCALGFNILNLHSINLYYLANNKAAKAYYKAGFRENGRRRDAAFNLGKYTDMVYMDILEDEFREKFPEYTLFNPDNQI